MTDRMRVFFVAPCLSMGGIERAAVNTANGLSQHGAEVVYLSLFKKPHFFTLNSEVKLIEPVGFNLNSLNLLKSIAWIRVEVKKYQPTHVLAFNKLYGAITSLALVGINIPLFISERSSPLFKWQFPFNWINRIAYSINPPKGVIAQTGIAADFQGKYFKHSKVIVIPNSLREISLFPDIRRKKIILAVGRLNDYLKGFDLLFHAISKLKNQDWDLHIAGGDGDDHSLEKLAFDLGISHRVKFLGRIKDMDFLYGKAGLFVIPSRSEGFPNALAEAMAAGCCCVAFDFIAGPRDMIVHGENGFIVTNGDISALANAMDELILDANKRRKLGINAQSIRGKLEQKVIVEKIKSFIENGV